MSASPEFYRPPAPPAFSPLSLPLTLPPVDNHDDDDHQDNSSSCCRTPTAGITYLRREAATCPPAPRKPKPSSSCKKRLFPSFQDKQQQEAAPVVISLRLDDLQRLFRPVDFEEPEPQQHHHHHHQCDDKRRRLRSATCPSPTTATHQSQSVN